MLTILHDPAGITGRTRHPWDYSLTLQQNIERHLDSGYECDLLINGERADPLSDQRMDQVPCVAMAVTVVQRPGAASIIYWAYVAIAAYAVYAYATMPNVSADSAATKDSPNNKLTGQTNVARVYQAIPDVYGYRRVWPDLIQNSTTEYVNNIKYVTEWLCVSRGKGTISDVRYADTPISDIDGASYEVFAPVSSTDFAEDGVTTLLDVVETFPSEEVNGQEIYYIGEVNAGSGDTRTLVTTAGSKDFTIRLEDKDWNAWIAQNPGKYATIDMDIPGVGSFVESCLIVGYTDASSDNEVIFTFRRATNWSASYNLELTDVAITPTTPSSVVVGPFTLPQECSRLRWNVVFQRGLRGAVDIVAEWWKVDGAGVEIAGTRQSLSNSYSARTYDARYFTETVTPSAGYGRYRIQFKRTDVPKNDGTDLAKLEELYAMRYYASKTLPGVTVIRVTTKATQAATGFSDRKFNLRWQRHVRTLASTACTASRNFARAMAHVWTLAGNSMAELDVDTLAAINAELGETSPLLRYDGCLDDADMSLGERLQQIADHARCYLWRDGTKWTVTREQSQPVPEVQFDYRNLAGSGDSTITVASHLPASYDGVEIQYVDESEQNKKAYERWRFNPTTWAIESGKAANPKKITLAGCTSQAQALNRAHLEIRRLKYQRTTVGDTALSDGGIPRLRGTVRWIDPNDFAGDDGLQAGEVLGISGDVIRTSEPLHWNGETSGRILLTGENGLYLTSSPIVCYPVSDYEVRLASVPAGAYVADGDRQLGSRYAFAVGLTEAELESAGLYVVTDIKPSSDGTVSIACANYDERIFEMD